MTEITVIVSFFKAQVETAIMRMPSKYRKDAENVISFLEASEKVGEQILAKALITANFAEVEEFLADLTFVARLFIDGLVSLNPSKMSLSWLFNFDPFKAMRLEADSFARSWGLDWKR